MLKNKDISWFKCRWKTVEIIQRAENEQMSFEMSHKEVKDEFSDDITEEMENSQDTYDVERN